METKRVVCGHDCPDMCSLLAHIEGGKVTRISGDPDQPFTAGFACTKVNRDAELVHSPDRIATPLRRVGAKGGRDFKPISWDDALDEITTRWKTIIAQDGPLALLGYAYSAHQGQLNRGLLNGLFHALGTSRLQAGTVCDTCCETAWDMIRKKTNVPLIVIDPRRSKTAERADWHIPIRIGTDAALALGVMHILVRDGLCDRPYLEKFTVGFDRLERDVLPRFTPAYVAEVTGLTVDDVERLSAIYGQARTSFIRLGEGMTRLANGGQALRAVCTLPALTGAYGRRGGGALLMTPASMPFNYNAIRKPSGPATTRFVNHLRLGEELLNMKISRGTTCLQWSTTPS